MANKTFSHRLTLINTDFTNPLVPVFAGLASRFSTYLKKLKRLEWFDEHFYYLNFEDERLISFSAEEDFDLLYPVFLELYGEQKTFFFDEIQNVSGWERFVQRMYERGNKFVITGSNARLLSRELTTHLTGRHLAKEIYPVSFREFLRLKGAEPEKISSRSQKSWRKSQNTSPNISKTAVFQSIRDIARRRYFTGFLAIYSSGTYL